MVGRIAETVIHHDAVGDRRVDRTQPILAVQALVDEGHGGIDRALPRRFGKIRFRKPQDAVELGERDAHTEIVGGREPPSTSSGGVVNSSPIVIRRGLRARGRRAMSTSSGTRTVRDQYEILLR